MKRDSEKIETKQKPLTQSFIFSLIILMLLLAVVAGKSNAAETDDHPFLHPLFSDHMVLQRDRILKVWGWTEPGKKVAVAIHGKSATATAGGDGKWEARIGPFAAGGPYTLKVSGPQTRIVQDVLFGDVWLCAGQSNMEIGLRYCEATNDIAQANFPRIRLLTVPKRAITKPSKTLQCDWVRCNPTTVSQVQWYSPTIGAKGSTKDFSAAAFYFGRELHQELNVPIGLINSSWGGTGVEAWMSYGMLQTLLPDTKERLDDFETNASTISAMERQFDVDYEGWCQTNDPGTQGDWFKADTDFSSWKQVVLPWVFNHTSLEVVWFQHKFDLPTTWADKDLTLSLGPIDDIDTTWVNGIEIGQKNRSELDRVYHIPASAVKAGRNTIAIRIFVAGGPGGFAGTSSQMYIVPADGDQASAISLAGRWQMFISEPFTGLEPPPLPPRISGRVATVLYNGMIAPLTEFGIKGVAWYQGESNVGRAWQYRELLTALIQDWRHHFGMGDFPFYIVQICTEGQTNAEPRENLWGVLREAQAQASQTVSNSALAVTVDLSDPMGNVHFKNKQEVGRRLALCALAKTYGKPVEWSGPWYKSMVINGSQIQLSFDHLGGGLVAKGERITGFSIAGTDRKFVWADVAINEDNTVVVSSAAVAHPVAVRYAWDNNPICNLCNQAGLPAVPFRTDGWKMITQDNK